MTASLDISVYPHILKGVIDSATFPSLLCLRATCHGVKRAVDIALFSHISVSSSGTTYDVRSPTTPFERLPSLPAGTRRYPLPTALALTRTVDYYGCVYVTPQLPNLAIVRRRTKMAPPKSPVLVDYAMLREDDWPHIHVPSVSRWVLHVFFDSAVQAVRASFELILPNKPLNMVVVFHCTTFEDGKGEGRRNAPLGNHVPEYIGIMNCFRVPAIRATEKGTVTFVGVDGLPPQALGMPEDLTPLEIVQRAQAGLKAELVRNLNHGMSVAGKRGKEAIQHVMGRITWPTQLEWEASLPNNEKSLASIPVFRPLQWPGGPNDLDFRDPAFCDGFSDFSDDSDF